MNMNKHNSDSMTEQQILSEYMDSIQAPSALRKDILMKKDFPIRHRKNLKAAALAAGITAAGLFAVTDGIVYAATNEGLLTKIIVTFNGKIYDYNNFEKKTDGSGNSWYEGTIHDPDRTDIDVQVAESDAAGEDVNLQIDIE